jgi:hypothetical protein
MAALAALKMDKVLSSADTIGMPGIDDVHHHARATARRRVEKRALSRSHAQLRSTGWKIRRIVPVSNVNNDCSPGD